MRLADRDRQEQQAPQVLRYPETILPQPGSNIDQLLTAARAEYDRPHLTCLSTFLNRAMPAYEWLSRNAEEHRATGLDIAIVGAGMGMGSSYGPFQIAADCDSRGIDYRMTIVDIDPLVVAHLRQDEHVIACIEEDKGHMRYWQKYLDDTRQRGAKYVENPLPAVTNQLRRAHQDIHKGWYLNQGVPFEQDDRYRFARIPKSFVEKRQTGEVAIIQGDIAKVALPQSAFDVLDINYVLYQIPKPGRLLAMSKIAQALKPGGRVLFQYSQVVDLEEEMKALGLERVTDEGLIFDQMRKK